jgi:hypothetical protein
MRQKLNHAHKVHANVLQNKYKTNYSGIAELWANEQFLKNYNADIINKLTKFSDKNSKTLDFGAGLGTLAKIYQSVTNTAPDCIEIDDGLRKILSIRKFCVYENLDKVNKKYDLIYTSNVLEHINDDVRILDKLNSKIESNGLLAIFVPAFMCIYNRLDSSVGHYRRYKKDELVKKLLNANFEIKECYYVDSIGFFAWLAAGLKEHNNKTLVSSGNLKIYDEFIYPISSVFDSLGFKHLFGKNLIVIAKKR